jgi:hypothetical protein
MILPRPTFTPSSAAVGVGGPYKNPYLPQVANKGHDVLSGKGGGGYVIPNDCVNIASPWHLKPDYSILVYPTAGSPKKVVVRGGQTIPCWLLANRVLSYCRENNPNGELSLVFPYRIVTTGMEDVTLADFPGSMIPTIKLQEYGIVNCLPFSLFDYKSPQTYETPAPSPEPPPTKILPNGCPVQNPVRCPGGTCKKAGVPCNDKGDVVDVTNRLVGNP